MSPHHTAQARHDYRISVPRRAFEELAACQGVDLSDDRQAPWTCYLTQTSEALFISLVYPGEDGSFDLVKRTLGARRRLIVASLNRGWRFTPGQHHRITIDAHGLVVSLTACRPSRRRRRRASASLPLGGPRPSLRAARATQLRQQGLPWKEVALQEGYANASSARASVRDYCVRHGLEYPSSRQPQQAA